MNSSNASKNMGITIKNYPMHLLIPSVENVIVFQAINYLSKKNQFQFNFEGENLEIQIQEELNDKIKFNPSETKEFSIRLIPKNDGQGKLIINCDLLKEVKRKVKVKKIRDSVPKSRINEIFTKYKINLTESIDPFNYQDYFLEMNNDEINRLHDQINRERNSGQDVDDNLKNLARAYLYQRNIQKSLEVSMLVSDEQEKYGFYYDLIRAYSSADLDTTIHVIQNLKDVNKKFSLIKNIALEQVKVNPQKACKLALLIDDPYYKIKLLMELIEQVIKIDTAVAFDLSHFINNELSLAKVLINIAQEHFIAQNRQELIKTIRQILNIFIHSPKINLSEKNYKNTSYEFLLYVLQGIAEVEGPVIVNSIIEDLPDLKLKENLHKNLDNSIFEIKQETQLFYEPTPVYSQYFMFNMLSSMGNEDLKYFSSIGGNVSKNLILREYNFRTLIISLFSFNFSIYPMMERLYTELSNVIAYYIFPSISNHDKKEENVINSTLNLFMGPNRVSQQINVYNVDFIPYLGKPTVIIASESNQLHDKIKKVLGNSGEVFVDDNLFHGGRSSENLKKIFLSDNFKIINLVLSYEFINDFTTFKTLMQALN